MQHVDTPMFRGSFAATDKAQPVLHCYMLPGGVPSALLACLDLRRPLRRARARATPGAGGRSTEHVVDRRGNSVQWSDRTAYAGQQEPAFQR